MKNTILSTGDIILDWPEPDFCFEPLKEILEDADFAVGQVEVPHTNRPLWSNAEPASAPASDPEYLNPLAKFNFKVATLAGNHTFDQGTYGVLDTRDKLRELGLKTAGSGENLAAARTPAIYESNGVKFAFLSYNCVGPRESWATPMKAGAAFIRVETVYVNDSAEPGGPPTSIYTVTDPACLNFMKEDIRKAKEQADVVMLSLHMGRTASPQVLQYELEIAHAAVDCGVSAIFCHHTHILESIEMYKGVPIYYGLGNFITLTSAFGPTAPNAPQRAFRPFQNRFAKPNFKKDIVYGKANVPGYVFTVDGRMTIMAKLEFEGAKLAWAGFVPCYINDQAQTEPAPKAGIGAKVYDYIAEKNVANFFDTQMSWNKEGTEVEITIK